MGLQTPGLGSVLQKTGLVVTTETPSSWSGPPSNVLPCSSKQPGWSSGLALTCRMTTQLKASYWYTEYFCTLHAFSGFLDGLCFLLHSPLRITASKSFYSSLHNAENTGIFSRKEGSNVKSCLSLLTIMKGHVNSSGRCRDHRVRCSVSRKNSNLKHRIR